MFLGTASSIGNRRSANGYKQSTSIMLDFYHVPLCFSSPTGRWVWDTEFLLNLGMQSLFLRHKNISFASEPAVLFNAVSMMISILLF